MYIRCKRRCMRKLRRPRASRYCRVVLAPPRRFPSAQRSPSRKEQCPGPASTPRTPAAPKPQSRPMSVPSTLRRKDSASVQPPQQGSVRIRLIRLPSAQLSPGVLGNLPDPAVRPRHARIRHSRRRFARTRRRSRQMRVRPPSQGRHCLPELPASTVVSLLSRVRRAIPAYTLASSRPVSRRAWPLATRASTRVPPPACRRAPKPAPLLARRPAPKPVLRLAQPVFTHARRRAAPPAPIRAPSAPAN